MPYDDVLAARLRAVLGSITGLEEKKMFGGVGFLVDGNMACGVHQDDLIVRVGAAIYGQSLLQPHTRPFDMTGRPMAGWIMVEPQGCDTQAKLEEWVDRGVAFARSLPPKEK
jgi:TfoX/Sxy family transcriptional regulator of competence genes